MKLLKASMLALAISVIPSLPATAGMITVSRLDTDDIVIPVFNTNLGTLTDVTLTVALRSGTTSVGGAHDHASYQLTSTNTYTAPTGMSSTSRSASPNGGHTHGVITPAYAGGGLSIGSFSFSTDLEGAHSHSVSISPGGYVQVGPTSYRAFAFLNASPYSGDDATYSGATNVLNYSGSLDVAPFLAPGDIVISAPTISTTAVGSHSHSVSSFSIGPWSFSSSSLPSTGSHALTLNPRFDVVAEFTYAEPAAVPEPSSLFLLGSGLIGCVGAAFRRRRHTGDCCA